MFGNLYQNDETQIQIQIQIQTQIQPCIRLFYYGTPCPPLSPGRSVN